MTEKMSVYSYPVDHDNHVRQTHVLDGQIIITVEAGGRGVQIKLSPKVAILSGALPAPGFERDPRPWLAVKWMPPGWDWVDPLKDVQADALAVANNFKSRSEVIAARGWDPEMIDAEIAADQERADRLGLSPVTAAPAAVQPEERNDAND